MVRFPKRLPSTLPRFRRAYSSCDGMRRLTLKHPKFLVEFDASSLAVYRMNWRITTGDELGGGEFAAEILAELYTVLPTEQN